MKISRSILLLLSACYGAAAANTTVAVDSMDDFSTGMGTYGTTEFQLQNSIEYAGELTLPVPEFKGTSWVITSEDSARPVNLYLNGGSYVVNTSNGSNNVSNATYTITKLNNISISNYTGEEIEQGGASKVVGAFYSSATGQKFYLVENTGSLTFSNNTNVREQVDIYQKPQHLFLSSAVFTQLGSNYMGVYLDRNAGGVSFSDNKTAYLSKEPYEGSVFGYTTTQQKTDENGNPVWQTDENGEVILVEEKDAFGNLVYEKDENGETVVSMVRVPVYETIVTDKFESSASTYSTVSGSCIFAPSGPTSISGNGGGVSFLRNSVINATGIAMGGAISASAGTVTINDNQGGVEMHANSVLSTWVPDKPAISYHNQGGVISAQGATVELCGNGLRGTSGDSIRITDNEVRAMGNSNGARGGAIIADKLRISDNAGGIQILNNRVVSEYAGESTHTTVVEGGAFYGSYGDNAFDISNNGGTVNIIGNYASALQMQVRGGFYSGYMKPVRIFFNEGDVNITDNYISTGLSIGENTGLVDHYNSAALGGAIYGLGLTIVGNQGDVVFRGNYEQTSDFTRLRSVVINSTLVDSFVRKFQISAVEGHSVTFYDSVFVGSSGADISFNGGDPDMGYGLGDVIFTGATTVTDLEKIKDTAPTEEEIQASRTSVFEAMANVYRGRLVVQDGAVLQGKGIALAAGSGATLRVEDATLVNEGWEWKETGADSDGNPVVEKEYTYYALTFNAGTTLELEGANFISGTINMLSGSTLNFIYGQGLVDNAVLTLTGGINCGSSSRGSRNYVQLSGFGDQKGVYKLIELTNGDLPEWDFSKFVFQNENGQQIDANHLVLQGNKLLYYNQLDYVEWPSDSTGGSWNSNSLPSDDSAVYFGSNDTLKTLTLEGDLDVYALTVQQGGEYEYKEAQSGASLSVEDSFVVEAHASVDVQLSQGVEVNTTLESAGDFKATKVTGSGNVSVTGGSLELTDTTNALDVEGEVTVTNTELRGTWTATDLSIGDSTVVAGADITLGDATITSPVTTQGTLTLQGKLNVQAGGLVLAGGNLVMNTSLVASQTGVIDVQAASTLTLNEGTEVFRQNIAGLSADRKLTVEGNGKLNLGNSTDITGYDLSKEGWAGTVKLEGTTGKNNLELNNLGQSGSTIELENCEGYAAWKEKEITANLVLTKSSDKDGNELAAITINNGFSKGSNELDSTGYYVMNTFSGTISGEGKMYFSFAPKSAYSGFEFTGNVKNWTGAFDMAAASDYGSYLTLKFSGKATDISTDIIKSTTKSTAVLDLLLAAGDDMSLTGDIKTDTIQISKTDKVEFSGNVNTGSLTVSDAAELIFSGESSSSKIDSISGAVSSLVVKDGTVELGSAIDTTAAEKGITVDGGVLNFGSARQSLNGNWDITLKNGATLKGAGTQDGGSSNLAAALDFFEGVSYIKAESGQNVIEADICLRNTSSLGFNVVDEKASLVVSGSIHSGKEGTKVGTLGKDGKGLLSLSSPAEFKWISHRDGAVALAGGSKIDTYHAEENGGTLQLSGDVQISTLQTQEGILNLVSTDEVEKKVTTLDASLSGNVSTGTIRLEKNTKLEVTGQIWESKDASIELAENSELKNKGFVFTNKTDGTAVLKAIDNGKAYSHELTEYSLENGYVKVLDEAPLYGNHVRMRNQLINTAVENAGDILLKVWNPLNSLSGVHATGASIQLFEQDAHHLKDLKVVDNLSVSAYKVDYVEAGQLATLHVDGTAEFGRGITLNANLVMEQGAVVTMADTVKLEGELNLQFGLTLKGDVLQKIANLKEGESYVLFTNVDALKLQTPTLYNMRTLAEETEALVNYSPLMDDTQVAAGDYFSTLAGNSNLVLSYNSTDGTVSITNSTQAIPEPATAALSLLGLAALVARRRRK